MLGVICVTTSSLILERSAAQSLRNTARGAQIFMATAQNPAAPKVRGGVQPLRPGEGASFYWRRLHSLLGIVPIGAFLLEHLISNIEALNGPVAYAAQVTFLNALPMVRVLEWTFIFIPILYPGNWLYVAQRWTGIIAFLYIGYHVVTQRFMGVSLPENPGASFHKVQEELANPLILAAYVIAMIAVCWHFAYGI